VSSLPSRDPAVRPKCFLKEPGEFKLIGKSTRGLDTPLKVNGSAVFAWM